MKTDKYKVWVQVMRALASPIRLLVVAELGRREQRLCELKPIFRASQSALRRHVAVLRRAGIVKARRKGSRTCLRLARPSVLGILDCARGDIRGKAMRRLPDASRRRLS